MPPAKAIMTAASIERTSGSRLGRPCVGAFELTSRPALSKTKSGEGGGQACGEGGGV
jgi:hypothetical protein